MSGRKRSFRFADLFAGIGGIRLGFERAGCRCVFTSEWNADARKTYSANWPGEEIFGDITKIAPESVPDHDILCAGFPCQPFSAIGRRQGFNHPTQGTLFFDVRNILTVKRPAAFFLENVPGFETHDGGRTLSVILDTLRNELGYETRYSIVDAADFGVPQHRRRMFFVGFRKDLATGFCFPRSVKAASSADIADILETDSEIFRQSRFKPNYATQFAVSRHLQEAYLWKKNDGHPQLVGSDHDPDVRINLRHGAVKTLCASYHKIQRLTGTFVKGGPTGVRMLTELECKRLQGFPDDFKVPVCRTSMYHQFGNSVAVPAVAAIAKQMVKSLRTAREGRRHESRATLRACPRTDTFVAGV